MVVQFKQEMLHGSVVFQENEGEYGGALMLAQNVSVVIGKFAKVSFVKNHAYDLETQFMLEIPKLSSELDKSSHLWKTKVTRVEL